MASQPDPEPFPWHLGVYDAHCHPTDTMSSIAHLPTIHTRCLTVMGTRGQDQSLVTQVAAQYGVQSADVTKWSRSECMVPSFGWHPWFAHLMYIEETSESRTHDEDGSKTGTEATLQGEAKIRHYQNVLQPSRDPPSEEHKQIFLSLPDPTPLSIFLIRTHANLQSNPHALIGEIGLDRSFRIPSPNPSSAPSRDSSLTPGGREGRPLTPFRCHPAHQKALFKAQLQLAAEMGRAVSIHSVQAHGMVFETLRELWTGHERRVLSKREKKKKKKRGTDQASVEAQIDGEKDGDGEGGAGDAREERETENPPYPTRICLHSYSGNASNFKQYLNPATPLSVFASFSSAINLGDALGDETPPAFVDVVRAVPDHMLLVESDLHVAGEEMDRRMEDIVRRVCAIKGWGLDEGVRRLGRNWRRFVFGDEAGG
ncbi:Metallo-dependent hydrolase [Lentithecium fluviatile CBS 122367]|uniref:Metallo-dependent hydrolase n=1 Tax=Lentithecium fluviatile CBS 122367 TaxID=1168545 RepID=A0A6G1J1K2_9PLEO|nr:Metallo-dependent hydrolase [Lentithecium fluviatile CBS 122367]